MASVNKVILVGNLGRDPEVRYNADGNAVCNFSIATTSKWKDRTTGEAREETEWHRIVMYNRLAEIAGEYLRKGRPVYVEGRLRTRKWTGQDGQERYTTEIIAHEMQMLGGGRDASDQDSSYGSAPASKSKPASGRNDYEAAKNGSPVGGGLDNMEDDIPF